MTASDAGGMQLVLCPGKNSGLAGGKPGCLSCWLNNDVSLDGLRGTVPRVRLLTYSYQYNVGVGGVKASIGYAQDPWTSWTDRTSSPGHLCNTGSGSGSESVTVPADPYNQALRLRFWCDADVAASAGLRYIKLTDPKVWLTASATDLRIDQLLQGCLSRFFAPSKVEVDTTLPTLAHVAYRVPTDVVSMAADMASRSETLIDWALWGDVLYARQRVTPDAAHTVLLQRSDLIDAQDGITADVEAGVDGVLVIYASDGTVGSRPRGSFCSVVVGDNDAEDRVTVLDFSSEQMSTKEATDLGQREYARANANAYRGSLPLKLRKPLRSVTGAPIDPLLILPGRGWSLDRSYEISHAPITITGTDFDLDAGTVTVSVGPQEERDLYQLWEMPEPGVTRRRVYGPWHKDKKNRKRHRHAWWEFG